MSDESISPTFLDIVTGRTATTDRRMSGFTLWWWAEGNGSCDCNRGLLFDDENDESVCCGAHRYVAVDVDIAGADAKVGALEWINSSYPDEAQKVAREWKKP
jgi:hypothetical protein